MRYSSFRISTRALIAAGLLFTGALHAETIDTTSGDITRATPITDGTLTKIGTGTLALTVANTLSGEVTVNDGTLAINHADALTGATNVSVNATKALAPVNFTNVGGLLYSLGSTLNGVYVPPGTYVVTDSHTLTSQTNSAQTYTFTGSPATTGILTLNTAVTGLDTVKVFGGVINGSGSLAANTLFIRNGTVSAIVTGATQVVINEASSSALVLPSTDVGGPAVLSGNNNYTGGTVVNAGTLEARSAHALGSGNITVNGTIGASGSSNTLYLPTSFTSPAPEGTENTSIGAGTLSIGGQNTYTGTHYINLGTFTKLAGGTLHVAPGTFTQLGGSTLTLGNTNTLSNTLLLNGNHETGPTLPATGTLTLSADVVTPGNLVLTGGTINGTGSLNAASFDVRAGNITAKLTGIGALVKSGDGTVELSGTNNYTGGTTVNAGKLSVTAPGTLNGNVTVNGGVLYLGADQTLAKLDLATPGGVSVDSGETRIHSGNLAGNIVVAAGATLSLDGTARIVQPEGGHPDNVVVTPSGTETLSTSVLLVNGTLNLIGNDHMLGLVTGSGDIHLNGGATYSMAASRFTGRWFLGDQPPEPGVPDPHTPPTPEAPAPRPAPTGGLMMNGTIMIDGNASGATGRVMNISGEGEAIVISDWTGQDTINIRDGITFNLGQGVYHSIEVSFLQIDSGATLKGLGTITGSVMNNGRIAPGNSPGVITIGGDFTNGPAGVVDIEIAGVNPGTGYDVIRYAGQAILNGGTLNVTLLNGFKPTGTTTFRFLEDTDLTNGSPSVTGAFTTVNLPTGLYSLLTTDTSGMTVTLSPTLAGMPGVSVSNALLAADQAAAANAPLQAALQATYATSGGAAAAGALRAVSPVGFGALPGMALDSAREDVRTVTDRASAQRALAASAKSDLWEAYVGYTGRFSEAKSGVNAPDYDSNIQSGHVGLENVVAESLIIGVTPAYARGEASLNNGSGKIDMDRASLTGYAAYVEGDTVAQVGLRAGYLNYDTKRTHLLGKDLASTDGYELGAFAGVSHALRVGDFVITPEASLGYTYADIGGFGESGTAAALRVRNIAQDSLRARLGSSFDWLAANNSVSTIALGLGLGAEQELLKQHADIRASYAGGSAFDTASAMNARTTVDVGPQLTWTFSTGEAIRFGYRYEYGFDETVSHRVDASYSKRF